MTDRNTIFVDSLISASIREGTVRLEFGEFEHSPDGNSDEGERKAPELVSRHRLILPVGGFERSMDALQRMSRHLREQAQNLRDAGDREVRTPAPAAPQTDGPFVAEPAAGSKAPDEAS